MTVLNNTGIRAGASAVVAGGDPYNLKRSTRFNPGDTAYLNRDWVGHSTTFTLSCWFKRSLQGHGSPYLFFTRNPSGANWGINFGATGDNIRIFDGADHRTGDGQQRDPSAFYHLVFSVSSGTSTTYINGEVYAVANVATTLGISGLCTIGKNPDHATNYFYDGYLADFHIVDGTALTPTSFAETNATTGQWIPKEYTGSYGTNGFHLAMDPAESGTIYSDGLIGYNSSHGQQLQANAPATKAFNGVIGSTWDGGAAPLGAGTSTYIRFTPPSQIAANTVKVHINHHMDVNFYTGTPGSSTHVAGPFNTSTSGYFTLVDCGSVGAWDYMQMDVTQANYGAYFGGIEVGGKLLTDHTAIGHDSSGEENHWHEYNLSTTAGTGNDLLADVPGAPYDNSLNGGGNYATLNPLQNAAGNTFSNGNLQLNTNGSGWGPATSTIAMKTGKWYFEVECTSDGGDQSFVGIVATDSDFAANTSIGHYPVCTAYQGNSTKYTGGGTNASYGASWGAGDTIGVAFDADNHTVTFYLNGVSQGVVSNVPDDEYFFGVDAYNGSASFEYQVNFGQRAFSSTPPTGYKALNSYNLTDPTIVNPSDHFDVGLDTGSNILTTATGLTDGADFVWIKDRANNSTNHILFNRINDSGMDGTPHLRSNEPDTEATCGTYSAPSGNSVAWVWNAGTTTDPTNTDGTITSSVRASPTAGFSCVSYSGNGTAGATVGHGLNSAPEFTLVKCRDVAEPWVAFHTSTGNTVGMRLTAVAADSGYNWWNSTTPGSSVFTLGNTGAVNGTNDYTAFCWSEVAGYSRFSSYEGNGDANGDGPFVWCGFKPRWIMLKCSSNGTENWHLLDTERDPYNLTTKTIYANLPNLEGSSSVVGIDILSNGFKVKGDNAGVNEAGWTYIFCAFASSPFKYSNAR